LDWPGDLFSPNPSILVEFQQMFLDFAIVEQRYNPMAIPGSQLGKLQGSVKFVIFHVPVFLNESDFLGKSGFERDTESFQEAFQMDSPGIE
jgi:hypothetical protein